MASQPLDFHNASTSLDDVSHHDRPLTRDTKYTTYAIPPNRLSTPHKMVLHDHHHMCMFCTECFESQEDWTLHLAIVHSVHQDAITPDESAPPTSSNEAMDALLSPFHSPAIPAVRPASYNPPAIEQAARSHLFTPDTYLGTPNTACQPPQPPAQPYATSNSTVSSQTSSQGTPPQPSIQITNGLALPRMVSKAASAVPSPHAVQYQSSIHHATTPATPQHSESNARTINAGVTPQNLQSVTRTIKIPVTPKKPKTIAAITPSTPSSALPPLPQAIFDLGLSIADFDPTIDHGELRTSANKYVDISPSVGLPDAHMFNAHCNKIISFGNLLRLASRYTQTDLIRKLNTNRTHLRFKSALITKRLKAAVKWAAGRPEWQGVGDVEAWLDGQRRAVESGLMARLPPAPKRKQADEPSDACQQGTTWAHGDGSPPPMKRARTATAVPSAQPAPAIDLIDLTEGVGLEGAIDPLGDLGIGGGELAAAPTELAATSMTGSSKYSLRATDFADLSDQIGSENAVALVRALGMGSGDAATAVTSPSPQGDGDSDDIFGEFVSQPADFMTPVELRMGEALRRWCVTWMERRGLTW